MFNVKNIKLSLKAEKISLNSVVNCLEQNWIPFEVKGNYLVIRHKYVYIFFKLRDSIIKHINVTKIPNVNDIEDCISNLKNVILKGIETVISECKIDNLTAIYDAKYCINLMKVLDNNKSNFLIRYNKEKFPGLFIRTDKGTFIIFHTGKVNLVGCQSPDHLPTLFECLEKILI
jgi:hypothetical protein